MKFLFKIFVLSLTLVGVVFFTSCEEKKATKTQVKRGVKKPAVEKPATQDDSVENYDQQQSVKTPDQQSVKTPDQQSVKKPRTDIKKPRYRYFLIIGSFQSRGNAERLRLELEHEYSDAGIINTPDGLYRVYSRRFSNRKEAFRVLEIVRNTAEGKDVWLHIK